MKNEKMKRISLLVFSFYLLVSLASCSRTFDKVVQTYDNGNPMLVYTYKGSEKDPILVAEHMYYNDGQMQFEKHFKGNDATPDGIWKYYFDNGQLFASANFTRDTRFGKDWQFFNREGNPWYEGLNTGGGSNVNPDTGPDSVFVTDLGMFGTPTTVVFCSGTNKDVVQFYSNYTVRSTERLVNGKREGRVIFYYPGGLPQAEAFFENGVEQGSYTVFQPNGIPYYRGQYTNGKRTGVWEFYDEEGNLANTQDYGNNL